jgi:ADP-dependent NAD(P)H-hydrate dehydratase
MIHSTPPLSELLQNCPLPPVGGNKHNRGTAVIVAGSPGCPGGAILSAVAALRAGAGRVQVLTVPTVATAVAVAVPETYVCAWDGHAPVPREAHDLLADADAVLIGPGMNDDAAEIACRAAASVAPGTLIVLDARALPASAALVRDGHRLALIPNEGEAAELVGATGDPTSTDPDELASTLTERLKSTVAVRGERTILATPVAQWHSTGDPGLGTAGSGDVMAGLTSGFAARGLEDHVALGWAVATHCAAGQILSRGRSNPGYLARELLDAIPDAVNELECDAARPDGVHGAAEVDAPEPGHP